MRWYGLLLSAAGLALADGGMVVPPGQEIIEYGQVAVIKHFGGVEELSIATQFHATSGFAWILPLPSRPEVDSFDSGLLYALQEHCRPLYRGGANACGCGYAGLEDGYLESQPPEVLAVMIVDLGGTLTRARQAVGAH